MAVTIPNQHTPIPRLRALWHVQRRVRLKEATRLQTHRQRVARHDWIVLGARVVRQTDRVPHYNVLVVCRVAPRGPRRQIVVVLVIRRWERLVRVLTGWVPLSIAVGRDPEGLCGVGGAAGVPGRGVRKERLLDWAVDGIGDGVAGGGVEDRGVGDFMDAVGRGGRGPGGGEGALSSGVADAEGVRGGVEREGDRVFFDKGVFGPVEGGVDAEAED